MDNIPAENALASRSPGQKEFVAGPTPISDAESAINAILDLLERNKNNNNPGLRRAGSCDHAHAADSNMNVDHNAQLVSQLSAIVENYQVGKDFIPRSGVAELGIDLSQYNEDGKLPLIQRVSDTEADALDLQLRNTTHHLTQTIDHVENYDDFINNMMVAGRRNRTRKPKYKNVQVLLITWKEVENEVESDVQVVNNLIEDEVMAVHSLFRDRLHFSVERYAIPSIDDRTKLPVNSQSKLQLKISTFVDKYDDEETLLVFYYNGHGSYWEDSCYWHPTVEASEHYSGFNPEGEFCGPSLKWNPVQDSIVTEADVLIVLDCCYAGASLINTKGPRTTKEILTACGKAQKTPAGPNSFTMRFIEAVNEMLLVQQRFQVTELYSRIVSSAKKPDPLHVIRGTGSITIECQPNSEPNNGLKLQIPDDNHGHSTSSISSVSALDHSSVGSQALAPGSAQTETSSICSTSSSLKVTLVVRVKDDIKPTFANWEACINALPPEEVVGLESVKIEAAFPTNSTLLIVSMPIPIWLLLPGNPAYSFIGFVKGNNMLLPEQPDPEPITNVVSVSGSNSDKAKFEKDAEPELVLPRLIAAMQDFFENPKLQNHMKERRPGVIAHTCQQLATKWGVPSRLESDPRFSEIQHLVQELVVVRNDEGDYTGLRYDLHFIVEKLFEKGKKTVKEALDKASPKNGELETTITTEIDQLEKKVFNIFEEKLAKAYAIDPRTSFDNPRTLPKSHVRPRPNVTKYAQQSAHIPEDREALNPVTSMSPPLKSDSHTKLVTAFIPRTESSTSLPKAPPRSNSMKSKHGPRRTDSGSSFRPLMGLWGRRFSRDDNCTVSSSSPMTSPRSSRYNVHHGIAVCDAGD